jgi:hypothetical protein
MSILVTCPKCGSKLQAPDNLVGGLAACPRCATEFTVYAREDDAKASEPYPLAPPPQQPPPRREPEPPYRERRRPAPPFEEDDWEEEDYPRRYRRSRFDRLQPGNGASTASLVFGILSLLFTCLCGLLAVPLPLLAIIFGCVGINTEGRGMATAGLVLGILSMAIVVLAVLLVDMGLMVHPRLFR